MFYCSLSICSIQHPAVHLYKFKQYLTNIHSTYRLIAHWLCNFFFFNWQNYKSQNWTLLLNVIYCILSPLVLCLVSPLHLTGSSSCTVHEQRSFERKAEEDDGKVSSWTAARFPPERPLSVALVSSLAALCFERRTSARSCVQGRPCWTWTDDSLRMGMLVCHHGDRQGDRHLEGSVSVSPSVPPSPPPPPPVLTPHRDTTPPHAAALEPAPRVRPSTCVREASIRWLPGDSSVQSEKRQQCCVSIGCLLSKIFF